MEIVLSSTSAGIAAASDARWSDASDARGSWIWRSILLAAPEARYIRRATEARRVDSLTFHNVEHDRPMSLTPPAGIQCVQSAGGFDRVQGYTCALSILISDARQSQKNLITELTCAPLL